MYFPTAEAAQAFAEEKGLIYDLIQPQNRKIPPKTISRISPRAPARANANTGIF